MEDKKKWDMAALASIPLIMTLGNSMLIPVLPTIEQQLGISSFQVSLLITIYSAAAILLIPVAGYLSDVHGRKKIIIPSLVIVAVGGLTSGVGAWVHNGSFVVVLLGRLVQGVGVAGTAPVVLPLIGDLFNRESEVSRGLGIVEMANTAGKVLSPIVGSLLAAVVWFLPFLAIPVFCLVSIVLVLFLVKSPGEQESSKSFNDFYRDTRIIFKQKGSWLYAIFLGGAVLMFVLFAVLFYLSETLEVRHNIHGFRKGIYLAMPLAVLSMSSYLTGKKIGENKLLMKRIVLTGLILQAAAGLISSFLSNTYYHLGLLLLGGIGLGASLPSLDALITEGIKKEERGTITSIYSSMRFIGVALGPPTAVLLLKFGAGTMYSVLTAVTIIALIVTFTQIKPGRVSK